MNRTAEITKTTAPFSGKPLWRVEFQEDGQMKSAVYCATKEIAEQDKSEWLAGKAK